MLQFCKLANPKKTFDKRKMKSVALIKESMTQPAIENDR